MGEESTWGTAVARSVWFGLRSATVTRNRVKSERGILHNGASGNIRSMVVEREECGFTAEIVVTYEGFGLLLKHCTWGSFSTSGSGPYTHVLKFGNTAPTGGLTVEIVRGSEQAGGQAYSDVLEGVRINKATFFCEVGGQLLCRLEGIAQTSSRGNTGTPSYTTSRDLIAVHYNAGTFGWNSGSYTAKSFQLMLDNKLQRHYGLGSLLTEDPAMGSPRSVELEVTAAYRTNDFETGLHADTQADASLTFTGGANSIAFEVHNAELTSVGVPISTHGVLIETFAMRGLSDGTDEGVEITLVNTQATATTA